MTKSIFPLPIESFPIINISDESVQRLDRKMTTLLKQMLHVESGLPTTYKAKYSSKYKFRREYHGINIDQVIDLLNVDNMSECRRVSALFHDDLLDAALLKKIIHDVDQNYLAIKWTAHDMMPLVKKRDTLSLQKSGFATDLQGNRIGYYLIDAVGVPEWPELDAIGLVRMKIQQVLIFRQSVQRKRSYVEVFATGSIDTGIGMPKWLSKLFVMSEHKRVNNLFKNACTSSINLPTTNIIASLTASTKKKFESCIVCSSAFSSWKRRKYCACCGENICTKCSVHRKVFGPNNDINRKKVRLCKVCLTMDNGMSDTSASSNHSDGRLQTYIDSDMERLYRSSITSSVSSLRLVDESDNYDEIKPSNIVGIFDSCSEERIECFMCVPPVDECDSSCEENNSSAKAKPKVFTNADMVVPPLDNDECGGNVRPPPSTNEDTYQGVIINLPISKFNKGNIVCRKVYDFNKMNLSIIEQKNIVKELRFRASQFTNTM